MHDSPVSAGTPASSAENVSGSEPGLLVAERRNRIVELLQENGRVTVEELSTRFVTSAVTIRTDLTALERSGAAVRTHGGALLAKDSDDRPLAFKRTLNHPEKVRIAKVAVSLIRDGETIILDSGTTTAEIAKQLRKLELQSLNVITNALNIATLLSDVPFIRLIMPGGILRPESNSLSGHMAEAAIADLQADRLFLGADGIDPERGVMTPHLSEAQLNARMMGISRQVIAVADASKFLRRNISLIARTDQLHLVITNSETDPALVAALESRGVEVRLA